MTWKYRVSGSCLLVVALAAFLLAACASMNSSQEELRGIGENEGIVIGSVLLTVEQGDAKESGWAFLKGRKAGDIEYAVNISSAETGFNPFKTTYSLPATPGQESFFVKKLPAGKYRMDTIQPSGLLAPQLSFPLGIAFVVQPRGVSYIGKLVVNLPNRISMGRGFKYSVQDAQGETIDQLRNDYPAITARSVKDLAGGNRGQNGVPGKTGASLLLQRDTLAVIHVMDGADDTACTTRTVVDTEIVSPAISTADTTQERWLLDRCGKTIPYLVTFTPGKQGGTDISVKQEK